MNNNEYFVPDIEDFYVGYEFEFEGIPKGWHKMIFSIENTLKTMQYNIEKLNCIRVPYLTKEQIEAEGWREIHDEEYIKQEPVEEDSASKIWWFNNNANTEYLSTFEFRHRGYNNVKFQGEIKSINEFRYICKLLKIE